MPRADLKRFQLSGLQHLLQYIYKKVPFYKKLMSRNGSKPEAVEKLADLQHLPFTRKDDLRQNYPFNMLAVPADKLNRIHASSGTTGKPTIVGYTATDLNNWRELTARIAAAAGVTGSDTAQVAFGYGLFTGGLGMHAGLEALGAAVIPASGGNSVRQLTLMQDLQTTALVCTPSYALHLIDLIKENNLDPAADLKLKYGLFGAEPWTDQMRRYIETELNISATDNYGLSEVIGPGVCGECYVKKGMHINEDNFIVEIIDPATGKPLPSGRQGEVVITTLAKQALPLLRYRTGDISALDETTCSCGRTTARLQKILYRCDDMLIIKGVNIYPSQIEEILLSMPGLLPHYLIEASRREHTDRLTITVELKPKKSSALNNSSLAALKKQLSAQILSITGIKAELKIADTGTLQRSAGKARHIIDHRNLNQI